jgi:hypothetical protein
MVMGSGNHLSKNHCAKYRGTGLRLYESADSVHSVAPCISSLTVPDALFPVARTPLRRALDSMLSRILAAIPFLWPARTSGLCALDRAQFTYMQRKGEA